MKIYVRQEVRLCDICYSRTALALCLRCNRDFCIRHGYVIHGGNADSTELSYCYTCNREFMIFVNERNGNLGTLGCDFADLKEFTRKFLDQVREEKDRSEYVRIEEER